MKKIFFLLIVNAFTIFLFNSCKSDEEVKNTTNPLVGTWKALTSDGEDISAENDHVIFTSSGYFYDYFFDEEGCTVEVSGYSVNGNTLTIISEINENGTFSINGDILTAYSTDEEGPHTSTFQRVSSVPEACNLSNDANLEGTWTLTSRKEDYVTSTDPSYVNCNKNEQTITFNSNGTFTVNASEYNSTTMICTPKNESGTWKTLNGELVINTSGEGESSISYFRISNNLELAGVDFENGKYIQQFFSKQSSL